MSQVTQVSRCRGCDGGHLHVALDLGEQHLSDFRVDDTRPPRRPLVVVMCGDCGLVQLQHTAPLAELYHDRYSYRSGASDGVRRDLADVVAYTLARHPGSPRSWLDIASNDGTLLSHVPAHVRRVGIDPLGHLADEARRHASDVIVGFFSPDHFRPGEFDVVTSVSVFYDLDDIDAFVGGVARVLARGGIWVVQQNYLLRMLENNSVDNVSHEHLTYHTLRTMSYIVGRHGLEVVDVAESPVNGGCIRTVIAHRGRHTVRRRVGCQLDMERAYRLDDIGMLRLFARRVTLQLQRLRELVCGAVERGGAVYGYGASTRGGTLWQAAGLDVRQLSKVVERSPAKIGRYMSAIGAPIISEEQARAEHPELVVVGPWWFRDDFVVRERDYLAAGGKMVFPLPELEVVTG